MRLFNITNRPNNYPREHQIENVSFKGNRTIIIDNLQFDIQFYGTTWLVNSPEDESKIWNRNCGSIRTKRYKNLNKKYLTPEAKVQYLIQIMSEHQGCYLRSKDNGYFLLKM